MRREDKYTKIRQELLDSTPDTYAPNNGMVWEDGVLRFNPGYVPDFEPQDFLGVPLYSVFKRTGESVDKETFIECFKYEQASEGVDNYLRSLNKIIGEPVTVLSPTYTMISKTLTEKYQVINPNVELIEGLLLKITTDDVFNYLDDSSRSFAQVYASNSEYESAINKLFGYFDVMDNEFDGYFSYSAVRNKRMRDLIEKTLYETGMLPAEYGRLINNRHILIIEDYSLRESRIAKAIELLQTYYMPKSIKILSLII